MKVLPLVIFAVALPIGTAQPPKSDVVSVEIVTGDHKAHQARCGKGGVPANTIFVSRDEKKQVRVSHCVDKDLHNHGDHEASSEHGAVRVFADQRIRWVSTTANFSVVRVEKPKTTKDYKPQDPLAPDPLFDKFEQKSPREVISPQVPNIEGPKVILQLYKTTFDIAGYGLVDPDVVCGM